MTASDRVRVGMYGAGGHAVTQHLPNLKSIAAAEVVAVCDIDGDKARSAASGFDIPARLHRRPRDGGEGIPRRPVVAGAGRGPARGRDRRGREGGPPLLREAAGPRHEDRPRHRRRPEAQPPPRHRLLPRALPADLPGGETAARGQGDRPRPLPEHRPAAAARPGRRDPGLGEHHRVPRQLPGVGAARHRLLPLRQRLRHRGGAGLLLRARPLPRAAVGALQLPPLQRRHHDHDLPPDLAGVPGERGLVPVLLRGRVPGDPPRVLAHRDERRDRVHVGGVPALAGAGPHLHRGDPQRQRERAAQRFQRRAQRPWRRCWRRGNRPAKGACRSTSTPSSRPAAPPPDLFWRSHATPALHPPGRSRPMENS